MNYETTLSIVYEFLCELSRTNLYELLSTSFYYVAWITHYTWCKYVYDLAR